MNYEGLQAVAAAVGAGLNNFAMSSARAAANANAVSAGAQKSQGAFNQASANNANAIGTDRIAEQYAFNSGQASLANDFSREMWNNAAAFNHEEAEIQRNWLEHMESTKYLRAVKDMESAGLNPILAVTGGGISAGGGGGSAASIGTVSGQMASGGLMNGISASEGMYQGQQQYMGGMLGLMGAIISSLGSAWKTATQMPAGEEFLTSLMDFLKDDNSKYKHIVEGAKDKFFNLFDQQHLEYSNGRGQRGRGSRD